jgi:phage protein D
VSQFDPLKIDLRAQAVALDKRVQVRTFEQMTVAQVVEQIGGEWGYSGAFLQVDEPSGKVYEVLPQYGTDARFLATLARRCGCVFYCDHTGLHFHKRGVNAVPARRLTYKTDPGIGDIISIEPDSDFSRAVGKVSVRAVNPDTGEILLAEANNSLMNDEESWPMLGYENEVSDPADTDGRVQKRNASEVVRTVAYVKTPEEAQAEAARRLAMAASTRYVYRIRCVGDPDLCAKRVYELAGLPDMLAGNVYCKIAKHSVSQGAYTTELSTIRDGPLGSPIRQPRNEAPVNTASAPGDPGLVPVEVYVQGPDGYPVRTIIWRFVSDEIGMSVEGGGAAPSL